VSQAWARPRVTALWPVARPFYPRLTISGFAQPALNSGAMADEDPAHGGLRRGRARVHGERARVGAHAQQRLVRTWRTTWRERSSTVR